MSELLGEYVDQIRSLLLVLCGCQASTPQRTLQWVRAAARWLLRANHSRRSHTKNANWVSRRDSLVDHHICEGPGV